MNFCGLKLGVPQKKTIKSNIHITAVTLRELDTLQKISYQTFEETFASDNSEENMNKYLTESFSSAKLRTELNDSNAAFYFATLDKKVIGYLKINFGQSQKEIKNENTVEIIRIYVLKEYHGKEVGKLLYEKAMNIAKERNADYVWLGVWEENKRAINFYKKNGFVAFDKHIFKLGNDEQTDIMMKLELTKQE